MQENQQTQVKAGNIFKYFHQLGEPIDFETNFEFSKMNFHLKDFCSKRGKKRVYWCIKE